MSELKPCPFCGEQVFPPLASSLDDGYTRCGLCGAKMQHRRWQTRPIEDELRKRIAELESENGRLQESWLWETVCPDGSLRPKVSELLLNLDGWKERSNGWESIVETRDTRIAELEAAQRWIPVSERLPEECTPVLTLSKDNDKPVTAFLDAGFWWSNVDWALNVTHWMPLPQPPEERER